MLLECGMVRFYRMLWWLALLVTAPGTGGADAVLDWNAAFIESVEKQTPPPVLTARNLAILHLSMDAVIVRSKGGAAAWSAVGAGHEVCLAIFPSGKSAFDALLEKEMGRARLSAEERQWLEAGRQEARRVLALRANDGSATTVPYVPAEKPGEWRRTAPANRPPEMPHWGKVNPFALQRADQFRPPPPPALGSAAYARDVEAVQRLGAAKSTERTAEQTLAARFWSDFSYTPGPPGHWNEIARRLAAERRLSLKQSARLFARLNTAMADAGIACWDCKYHCNFWRPLTAIHRAGEDGNEATVADAAWESLLPAPPHPEYVSGHASFSGAAAEVLGDFFGSDRVNFTVTSVSVPGVERGYNSFRACAGEIASSRVWGGIHFPSAGSEGLAMGRKIGRWTVSEGARQR